MMPDNSEKRKQIRAYFFRHEMPLRPQDIEVNQWYVLGICAVSALFLAFATNTINLSNLSRDFAWNVLVVGIISALIYFPAFFIIRFYIKSARTRPDYEFQEQQKKYHDLLQKWTLKEADLKYRPNEAQIDTWLQEDFLASVTYALNKLGLVREELVRDPLIITGPIIWEIPSVTKDEIVVVKGHDNTLRFSCHRIVVICLSESRIASFSANFNFLKNVFLGERSEEYLYQDIVAVRTEEKSTNYNLADGKVLKSVQVFRLTVASGDSIEVAVNSSEIREIYGAEAAHNNYDGTVQVIREMLREKKG